MACSGNAKLLDNFTQDFVLGFVDLEEELFDLAIQMFPQYVEKSGFTVGGFFEVVKGLTFKRLLQRDAAVRAGGWSFARKLKMFADSMRPLSEEQEGDVKVSVVGKEVKFTKTVKSEAEGEDPRVFELSVNPGIIRGQIEIVIGSHQGAETFVIAGFKLMDNRYEARMITDEDILLQSPNIWTFGKRMGEGEEERGYFPEIAFSPEGVVLSVKDRLLADNFNSWISSVLGEEASDLFVIDGPTDKAELARPDIKRIGILTGGGLASGHNSLIAAAVREAKAQGQDVEIVGIIGGWAGLIEDKRVAKARVLTLEEVEKDEHKGGSIIHSTRTNPFNKDFLAEMGVSEAEMIEIMDDNMKKLGLDGVIDAGGDDTNSVAAKLQKAIPRIPFIGVPKTMDNDINLPEGVSTYGFDTFIREGIKLVNRLKRTAIGHERIAVVDTMGRNAGFTALAIGAGVGATRTLVPEDGPIDLEKLDCGS